MAFPTGEGDEIIFKYNKYNHYYLHFNNDKEQRDYT